MISSTIGELAAEREAINSALDGLSLADGWLFEFHATAAGETAEEHYLAVASSCDLYVVIVAGQGSEATEAEYQAAYADTSRKILPFFVGEPTKDTESFRSLIESRHVRVHRGDHSDLASAVVNAIAASVRSGEIVRSGLLEELDELLRRRERVVREDLPLGFVRYLHSAADQAGEHHSVAATSIADLEVNVVLEGIGGSGKTYTALATLRRHNAHGRLPIVIVPTRSSLSAEGLILGAFESVRFFPGEELLHQLARDGRIAVVVDGIDALASDDRRIFLADLDRFCSRFPRCRTTCCVRRAMASELASFARYTLAALSDVQTHEMFQAVGAPEVRRFPEQVSDLARWPLWTWALLEVGPVASTGLVLLEKLIEHRIKISGSYSPLEQRMLVHAGGALAFAAWPEPNLSSDQALEALVRWAASDYVLARYSLPSADVLIQRLSEAGVVQLTPSVSFAHPLFATYLGALHASLTRQVTDLMSADPEFAVFVAAMSGNDRPEETALTLQRHGAVGQARYLRLVPLESRTPQADDVAVFGLALQTLDGRSAECIVADDWTAWRSAEVPGVGSPTAITEWMSAGEVNFLPGNAFASRSPLVLATIESLARYKQLVAEVQPFGDRFDRLSERELLRLRRMHQRQRDDLVLEAVLNWRTDWRDLATTMKLAELPEAAIGEGDPVVTVFETWPDPMLSVDWNGPPHVTWVQGSPDPRSGRYERLSTYLDPGRKARVYQDLIRLAEQALGCSFSSQAWSRPETVASWAW
ncbi:MAG TPA: DUF4062 domain-containing protein [Acidimicrobiales bacterium]